MVEHRFEERRSSGDHGLESWRVIGAKQGIEKAFEFVLVHYPESIHVARAQITAHAGAKRNPSFRSGPGVTSCLQPTMCFGRSAKNGWLRLHSRNLVPEVEGAARGLPDGLDEIARSRSLFISQIISLIVSFYAGLKTKHMKTIY